MKIVAYNYENGIHCLSCAQKRFGKRLKANAKDRNNNEVKPVFEGDTILENEFCETCSNDLDGSNVDFNITEEKVYQKQKENDFNEF